MSYKQAVRESLELVLAEQGNRLTPRVQAQAKSTDVNVQRALLGDILISSTHVSESAIQLVDKVYAEETKGKQDTFLSPEQVVAEAKGAVNGRGDIVVWRGDICRLAVDAIVNAANDQGTGCYRAEHRCIDNVIHRAAGPALRQECHDLMNQRSQQSLLPKLLVAGSKPLVSAGYHLPAQHVLHVTGPCVRPRGHPTVSDTEKLTACYVQCLETCLENDLKSIAFCCISTGVFGYPQDLGCAVAVKTVNAWLLAHPGALDLVVFNTFLPQDLAVYRAAITQLALTEAPTVDIKQKTETTEGQVVEEEKVAADVLQAAHWMKEATHVLICSGAGLSVYPAELERNVYMNPQDFKKHYPNMPARGYNTAYECMGLIGSRSPATVKWGMYGQHMQNIRYNWEPNDAYPLLLQYAKSKGLQENVFVHTSNVDGCFKRSGFPAQNIYTPQGDWEKYQCMNAACPAMQTVYDSKEMLIELTAKLLPDGTAHPSTVPTCDTCQSMMFGNVRGGGWFAHDHLKPAQDAMVAWVEQVITAASKQQPQKGVKLVVLEIGAGFNTPIVTRYPMENIVRELGAQAALVRVNPTDPEVPHDLLKAVGLKHGWQILEQLVALSLRDTLPAVPEAPLKTTTVVSQAIFDWRKGLRRLA